MFENCSLRTSLSSKQKYKLLHNNEFFLPGLRRSALRPGFYKYFMNNIWQDAGTRTWLAATAVRCATNELNTVYFRTISVKCFSRYTVLSISVMNLSALLFDVHSWPFWLRQWGPPPPCPPAPPRPANPQSANTSGIVLQKNRSHFII